MIQSHRSSVPVTVRRKRSEVVKWFVGVGLDGLVTVRTVHVEYSPESVLATLSSSSRYSIYGTCFFSMSALGVARARDV